jgi:hypothetical protein
MTGLFKSGPREGCLLASHTTFHPSDAGERAAGWINIL